MIKRFEEDDITEDAFNQYEGHLLAIIDSVLACTDYAVNFCGSTRDYGNGPSHFKCKLEIAGAEGEETELIYYSHNGDFEGAIDKIDIAHSNSILGNIHIQYDNCSYSKKQIEIIKDMLESYDGYQHFLDAKKWYSRDHAINYIFELVRDGVIEWDETDRELCEDVILGEGYESDLITYEAEFGDVSFQYTFLEDPDAIQGLREDAADEDDPGAFYDYMELAPKLVIKAGDYYENTICDLTPEEEQLILGQDMQHDSDLDLESILVRTSVQKCINRNHALDKKKATVYIIDRRTYKKELYEIGVYYCKTCHRYYIMEYEYQRLKEIGFLCCKVINADMQNKNKYNSWNAESLLKSYGYSVSKSEGLSEKDRQVILDMIIENGICSKEECIEHIEFVLDSHCNGKNMEAAIEKWNRDINYLKNSSNPKKAIRIGKIIRY